MNQILEDLGDEIQMMEVELGELAADPNFFSEEIQKKHNLLLQKLVKANQALQLLYKVDELDYKLEKI